MTIMRRCIVLKLTLFVAILVVGCKGGGKGEKSVLPQFSDTLYSVERVRELYHQNPEHAMAVVDSAETLGVMNHDEASLLRARIYSYDEATGERAHTLCLELLDQGTLTPELKNGALDVLVYVARMRKDDEALLKYGMQYIESCRQLGDVTEALRVQANMGEVLIRMGRADEGFAMIDEAIAQLDGVRRFTELDAAVCAMKSKIRALDNQGRYADIIPVAERIVASLNDFGKHPADYDDGSDRMPSDECRPGYIDFYTGQAYAFMAYAYAIDGKAGQARNYLRLFERTDFSHCQNGKKMISSTWCLLGQYDKLLAYYDELEALWGDDTLRYDFALMLCDRATAARAKSNYQASDAYMQRYANLLTALYDSDRLATAQDYAARYQLQEERLNTEREANARKRLGIVALSLGVLIVVATVFALMLTKRMHDIKKKNAALSKEIVNRLEYKELYEQILARQAEEQAAQRRYTPDELATMSDASLFEYMRDVVVGKKLYAEPSFDRQQIEELLGISKERIGSAFAQGSPYGSLKAFLVAVRLEYAIKLLTDNPTMPVAEVATKSGFGSATVFNRNFKQLYALTPTEFRDKEVPAAK